MIQDFLIINFTGENNNLGLRINNKFFIKKLKTNIKNNESLVNYIFKFVQQKKAKVDQNFSVIVNLGPGSFSAIRISISTAKGFEIAKKIIKDQQKK